MNPVLFTTLSWIIIAATFPFSLFWCLKVGFASQIFARFYKNSYNFCSCRASTFPHSGTSISDCSEQNDQSVSSSGKTKMIAEPWAVV